jgi:hypothetical protein
MTAEEQRALLAVALLAAFADGDKSDAEREEVKRIAATLGGQVSGLNIPALMQDVLLKRLGVHEAVTALKAQRRNTANWLTDWPCVYATRATCCAAVPTASAAGSWASGPRWSCTTNIESVASGSKGSPR